MPLPFLPGIAQVRFVWEAATAPRPASFVLHFEDDAGLGNWPDLLTDIDANVTANMWDLIGGTARCTRLLATPLDNASATVQFTPAAVAKWQAGSAGDIMPQGAAVVTIPTALRGPAFRNRIYLPFINEGVQAGGTLTAGNVANVQTGFSAFRTAMGLASWPLVAVTNGGTQFTPSATPIVRPYLKTQRRRARR